MVSGHRMFLCEPWLKLFLPNYKGHLLCLYEKEGCSVSMKSQSSLKTKDTTFFS